MKPRKHQIRAANEVIEAITTGTERCQLVSACGTGKTLTTQLIADAVATHGLTIVTVPTIMLLAQTIASWTDATGAASDKPGMLAFEWMAVTGDPHVEPEYVDVAEMQPGTISRDVDQIAQFIHSPDRRKVIFSTHVSAKIVGDALRRVDMVADLLIVDEAHRAAYALSADDESQPFGKIVTGDLLPATYRLYCTATPRVFSGEAPESVEICSMDDTDLFGPVAHEYTFREAVIDGILVDFEVVVSLIRRSEVTKMLGASIEAGDELVVDGRRVPLKIAAAQVALVKLLIEQRLRKVVTFHSRVAQARKFAETLRSSALSAGMPDVTANWLSGESTARKRRTVLGTLSTVNRHRSAAVVVSNARVLTEGIDVPDLDVVMFVDSRASVVDVAQGVGRAVRSAAGKDRGYVLVPVLMPEEVDIESFMATGRWRDVWDTLAALRGIDPDLTAQFTTARRHADEGGGDAGHLPARVRVMGADLPQFVIDAVINKIIIRNSDSWEFHYQLLREFVAEHGHADVPQRYVTPNGVKLGDWVNKQRRSHRATGRSAA